MLLTEYQGKCLLREAGISIPEGMLVRSSSGLMRRKLMGPVAVKAQVGSGGRGKAGGVVKAETREEACSAAARLLNMEFGGEKPSSVLVEQWLSIDRELYLSVTVDPAAEGYVLLYSPSGGVDIESGPPPARYPIGPAREFRSHRFREVLAQVEPDAAVREKVVLLGRRLVELARARDCLTIEINPLVRLAQGSLVAADAKVVRDESAGFRADDIKAALKAEHKRQPKAIARALAGDLMLVWLDGSVGLISGGAGMTMATMDLIAAAGGKPACFLDCSANPTPTGYRLAFELLDSAPTVRVILVSIFGGLTQMDRVARVMREIMQARTSRKPVIFRLNGTNAERADGILAEAALHNHASLETAVEEAVAAAAAGSKQ